MRVAARASHLGLLLRVLAAAPVQAAPALGGIDSLSALKAACSGGGCAVGFLSAGNAQSVHNVLPPNTTVVIVKHTSDLVSMVQNGTLVAGLISGLPIDPNNTLFTFSSGQVSPRAMAMADTDATRDLTAALDAALVRVQLQGTDYTLAAANPPFRFVAVKTCKADALSALSYFPFPLAANATGVLAQALARRQLRIAALGPYNWGANDGDYTVSPPKGFWPDYLSAVETQLKAAYGSDFNVTRVYRMSSVATMQLLLDGQADATEPYWTVDSFFGGRARKANFRFSCTSLGADSTFFAARPSPTSSNGAGAPAAPAETDSKAATTVAVVASVVGVVALAFVLAMVSKERSGSPLFTPLTAARQGHELKGTGA